MNNLSLRQQIDDVIGTGDVLRAQLLLRELWLREPSAATAGFVNSRFDQIVSRRSFDVISHRLAILRSFTIEPLVPLLKAAAWTVGIRLEIQLGQFNTYAQELLDPASSLYRFEPQSVILAVETRSVAPELWNQTSVDRPPRGSIRARVTSDYRNWMEAFCSRTNANLIIHNLERPDAPADGILDNLQPDGQIEVLREVNRDIDEAARSRRGVFILDYDGIVARYGKHNWNNERNRLFLGQPIVATYLLPMVREWMRFLHPITGRLAKVCVVDLDNTLWGGVIGEVDLSGIQLSSEYPGAAFRQVQLTLLNLRRRGILLAIASKNNPDDAFEVFDHHPEMLLRRHHISAWRINWNDKASSLREIAHELNLGIDALAFVDDNPVERQRIREELPDVTVIELPNDPMLFAEAIRESPVFERLSLSDEDRLRGDLYAAERHRQEAEQSSSSPEEFLLSLGQVAEIERVNAFTLERVAQLTQKTNQFNLTTRRYTQRQIEELTQQPGWSVYTIRVKDRYGDNGLVGAAIVNMNNDVCELDTFLISCRVISRSIETALLSFLIDDAACQGCGTIRGSFIPTKKNAPCASFYEEHGFKCIERCQTGTTWEFGLRDGDRIPMPEWVHLSAAGTITERTA